MSNFSNLQKILVANRITLGDNIKPLTEAADDTPTTPEPENKPEEKQTPKPKINTSWQDVFNRLNALKRSYHNIPATELVGNLTATLSSLSRVKKTEDVINLVAYLKNLLDEIKKSTNKVDQNQAVIANITAIKTELSKSYNRGKSLPKITSSQETSGGAKYVPEDPGEIFDVETGEAIGKSEASRFAGAHVNKAVYDKAMSYVSVFKAKSHDPVDDMVYKILQHQIKVVRSESPKNFGQAYIEKLDMAITALKEDQDESRISYTFVKFPSHDMKVYTNGITSSLTSVYSTIEKYNSEFKDSDGKSDAEAENAVRRLLQFIKSQAESQVAHFEKPNKDTAQAAISNVNDVNKVLVSEPADASKIKKSKNIWEYIKEGATDNAESLEMFVADINTAINNLSNSAKKLINKDTNQPMWKKYLEPFFYLGNKPDNPDFIKLALYFVSNETFNNIIARNDLVVLISNSEVNKKNTRFLRNMRYISYNGQTSIIKDPNLFYWASRVKAAAEHNDKFQEVTNYLEDCFDDLLAIPSDFFADSINTDTVNNITDQIYYRLISTYGSQSDLQRLEKLPGNPSGNGFLTNDANAQILRDIESLINSKKTGQSLTGRLKTKVTVPYVKVNTISSILKTRGNVSSDVNRAISDALDSENILEIVEQCKNLSGDTKATKFREELFLKLRSGLDKIDPSGKLSQLVPGANATTELDPNSEEGKKQSAEDAAAKSEREKKLQKDIDQLESSKILLSKTHSSLVDKLEVIASKRQKLSGPKPVERPEKPIIKRPQAPKPPTPGSTEEERLTYQRRVAKYKLDVEEYEAHYPAYKKAMAKYEADLAAYPALRQKYEADREIFLNGSQEGDKEGLSKLNKQHEDLQKAVAEAKADINEVNDQIKAAKTELAELNAPPVSGSSMASDTGSRGAVLGAVKALSALTEDDISKIVSVLSSNDKLIKINKNKTSTIVLTPRAKSRIAEIYNDIIATLTHLSVDAAKNVLPRCETFKHLFLGGTLTPTTVNTFLDILTSNPGVEANPTIYAYIVELENLLNLPTTSEEIDTESDQYDIVKKALKELVNHRKLTDTYKDKENKVRSNGFDLVLHDFDAFLNKWAGYFSDLEDRRSQSDARSKEHISAAEKTQSLIDNADRRKREELNLARVLLPGSTLSGEILAVSPEQVKIRFLQNLKQFGQNAKTLYSMIREIVQGNSKFKKYLSTGSGVFDVGDTIEGTDEELKAYETFNNFAIGQRLEWVANGGKREDFDKTSDELWEKSGLSDEYRPFILRKIQDQSNMAKAGSDDFDEDMYDIFRDVIARFQRRLSTRPAELSSETSLVDAETIKVTKDKTPQAILTKRDISKRKAGDEWWYDADVKEGDTSVEVLNLLNTVADTGYAVEFPDNFAASVFKRMVPDNKIVSIVGKFFPGKTEEELIALRKSVVPYDVALRNYENSVAAWEADEEKINDAKARGIKPLPQHTFKKPTKKPEPTTAPILSDQFEDDDTYQSFKDLMREILRKKKVVKLPAFMTFAEVLRRAIDTKEIKNPIKIEVQSSAANLDHKVAAFLNLAASLVEFKDINNFLMGSIGKAASVVNTLFDSTSYPSSVTQDRSIVLCTRLYIIQSLLTAAKEGNLDSELKQVKVHFASDSDSDGKALNSAAQDTFIKAIVTPIAAAFASGGSLEKEYESTLKLLKTSIEGSNNVVPIITRTGDLRKDLVTATTDDELKNIIRSRGSVAVDLMRTSPKTPDGLRGLLASINDPSKLGEKLTNCVKIIASGINYTLGRELTVEIAKLRDEDPDEAARLYDADPDWAQFINTFKIVKKGMPTPTLVALDSEDTTGYHNLNNRYLSVFLTEFTNSFDDVRRLQKDKAVETAEAEEKMDFSSQKSTVAKLPVSIVGIFATKDTDLITGTVSDLNSPLGKLLSKEAKAASNKASKKVVEGIPATIDTVTTREALTGEETRDTVHGETTIAAGGEKRYDISVRGKIRELNANKNVTTDLLSGVVKSGSVKTTSPYGPNFNNNSIIGLKQYQASLLNALTDVINLFEKVSSGFEDAARIKQDLDAYRRNVTNAVGQVQNAFFKCLYEDGKLDMFNPEKQAAAIQYLKYIPFPLTKRTTTEQEKDAGVTLESDSIAAILTKSGIKVESDAIDDLINHATNIMGADSVNSKKGSRDDTAKILWAEVINNLIVNGSFTGEEVFNQFIQLFTAAPIPTQAVKRSPEPVVRQAKREAINLTTPESRDFFKRKFLESFFSPVADPSILLKGVSEAFKTIDTPTPSSEEENFAIVPDGETPEARKLREVALANATKAREEKWKVDSPKREQTKGSIKGYLSNTVVLPIISILSKTVTKIKVDISHRVKYADLLKHYETDLEPAVQHLNTLTALDNLAKGEHKAAISKLSVQITQLKSSIDSLRTVQDVVEMIIRKQVSLTEATADESQEETPEQKMAIASRELAEIVSYYRYTLRDRLPSTASKAALDIIIKEIRKDFTAAFLTAVFPKNSAVKKWFTLSGKSNLYIRFRVLPNIKIEAQTGNEAEDSDLYFVTNTGEKNYHRAILDVNINDFQMLGWLGNHALTTKQYEVEEEQQTPPEAPTE